MRAEGPFEVRVYANDDRPLLRDVHADTCDTLTKARRLAWRYLWMEHARLVEVFSTGKRATSRAVPLFRMERADQKPEGDE